VDCLLIQNRRSQAATRLPQTFKGTLCLCTQTSKKLRSTAGATSSRAASMMCKRRGYSFCSRTRVPCTRQIENLILATIILGKTTYIGGYPSFCVGDHRGMCQRDFMSEDTPTPKRCLHHAKLTSAMARSAAHRGDRKLARRLENMAAAWEQICRELKLAARRR
jgi:hypothetical protein